MEAAHTDDIQSLPPYTRELITWGRSDAYSPSLGLTPESEATIRELQDELLVKYPESRIVKKLHMTMLFCPPRHLFETVSRLRGTDPSQARPIDEATFYMDISSAIESHTMLGIKENTLPVESVETFDTEKGTIALKLGNTAWLSYWRESTRSLLRRNLNVFHGLTETEVDALKKDPKLTWMFQDSIPHISVMHGIHDGQDTVAAIQTPAAISFDTLHTTLSRPIFKPDLFMFDDEQA